MPSRTFEGTLVAGHKEDAVEVPFDPGAEWTIASERFAPGRRGVAVRAKIDGVEFTSFVVARSKRHWLLVDARIKSLANLATGAKLKIEVTPGN